MRALVLVRALVRPVSTAMAAAGAIVGRTRIESFPRATKGDMRRHPSEVWSAWTAIQAAEVYDPVSGVQMILGSQRKQGEAQPYIACAPGTYNPGVLIAMAQGVAKMHGDGNQFLKG